MDNKEKRLKKKLSLKQQQPAEELKSAAAGNTAVIDPAVERAQLLAKQAAKASATAVEDHINIEEAPFTRASPVAKRQTLLGNSGGLQVAAGKIQQIAQQKPLSPQKHGVAALGLQSDTVQNDPVLSRLALMRDEVDRRKKEKTESKRLATEEKERVKAEKEASKAAKKIEKSKSAKQTTSSKNERTTIIAQAKASALPVAGAASAPVAASTAAPMSMRDRIMAQRKLRLGTGGAKHL